MVVSLVIWTAMLIYIYLAVRTTLQFFIMAAIVALVLGGSQALSRSLYAQIIPKAREANITAFTRSAIRAQAGCARCSSA